MRIFYPLLLSAIIIFSACNKCRNDDCPIGAKTQLKINVLDSIGKSVYGSSSTQFNRNNVALSEPSKLNFSFEDSIIVVTQRFVVNNFNLSYNDSLLTNFRINYMTVSGGECCSDFQMPTHIFVDNQPLCDTCDLIVIEI